MSKGSSLDSKIKVWTSSRTRMGTAVSASCTSLEGRWCLGRSSPNAVSQSRLRLSPHFPGLGGQQGFPSVLSPLAFKSLQGMYSICMYPPTFSLPTPSLPLFQNGGVKSLREMKALGSIPSGQCSKEAINTLLLL